MLIIYSRCVRTCVSLAPSRPYVRVCVVCTYVCVRKCVHACVYVCMSVQVGILLFYAFCVVWHACMVIVYCVIQCCVCMHARGCQFVLI